MGGPEPSTSNFNWSQPRTSKPLRDFRPPLRTDPRNITANIRQLTLEDSYQRPAAFVHTGHRSSTRRNGTNYRSTAGTSAPLTSIETRAQHRLDQKREKIAESLPSKYNFRIISPPSVDSHQPDTTASFAPASFTSDFPSSLNRNKSRISEQKRVTFSDNLPQRYDSPIIEDGYSISSKSNLNFKSSSSASSIPCAEEPCCLPLQEKHSYEICGNELKSCEEQLKNAVQTNYVRNNFKGSQNYWKFRTHASRHQEQDQDRDSGVDSPLCSTPLPSLDTSVCSDSDEQESIPSSVDMAKKNNSSVESFDRHSESDVSFDQSSILTIDDEIICLNPGQPVPQPIPLIAVPEHLRRLNHTMSESILSDSSSGVSSLSHSQRTDDSLSLSSQSSCLSPVPKLGNSSEALDSSESSEKIVESWKASFSASSLKYPVKSSCNFAQKESAASVSPSYKWEDSTNMSAMGLPTSFGTPNNMKRKAVDSPRADASFEEMTNMYYSKRYKFQSADWKLPDPDVLFSSDVWKLDDFISLKQSLNAVKDELNDFPLQDWHSHTRRRNKAGNVIWQLRKKIDPELPTQAWCKFYENASAFPLVPQKAVDQKCLNSIHLCEAPGAFITSLNHFLHVNYGNDFKFDWRAVTLNPYYEGNPLSCMINDDRLILKTLDKWLFGKDNTGDLMNKENLLDIIEKSSELEEILLVTADGSIDCQNNPAEQEDIVSWLHSCETIAALHMLAPGGSFLIKMFTFYEQSSICLLYLLNCMFKNVTVNKPVTSKEGNSEVYVVCCGYKGLSTAKPWLDVLLNNYGPKAPTKALFPLEDLPNSFLDEVYNCADFFRKLQTDVIEENIRSYRFPQKRDNYVTATMRHRIADNFFSRYKVRKLSRDLYLVDKRQLRDVATPNIDPKTEEGSFNDRKKRMTLSPQEELKCLDDDLLHLNVAWPGDYDVFWIDFPQNPHGFKIVRGKPISKVNSSKFCLGGLLKIRNRVREIAYEFKGTISPCSSQCDDREIPWPDELEEQAKRKVFTLDFKNELWASLEDGSNAINEKNACRKILSAVENEIFRDDCLELRGYPLLTQFNVGLVYLLGHLFEKVGFVKPLGQDIRVLFYKYRKFNPEMKHHWDEVVSVMDHESEVVLSVVQISELSDGDFYKYVTEINNLCVVEQIKDLLKTMATDE